MHIPNRHLTRELLRPLVALRLDLFSVFVDALPFPSFFVCETAISTSEATSSSVDDIYMTDESSNASICCSLGCAFVVLSARWLSKPLVFDALLAYSICAYSTKRSKNKLIIAPAAFVGSTSITSDVDGSGRTWEDSRRFLPSAVSSSL